MLPDHSSPISQSSSSPSVTSSVILKAILAVLMITKSSHAKKIIPVEVPQSAELKSALGTFEVAVDRATDLTRRNLQAVEVEIEDVEREWWWDTIDLVATELSFDGL